MIQFGYKKAGRYLQVLDAQLQDSSDQAVVNARRCNVAVRNGIRASTVRRPLLDDCELAICSIGSDPSFLMSSCSFLQTFNRQPQAYGNAARCSLAVQNGIRAFRS